jgi:predicted DNA-binding transcriptional regulator AlpA
VSDYLTLPQLAELVGRPLHVVRYAVERHGPRPHGRIGSARVWPRSAIEQVLDAVRKSERPKRPRGAA